MPDWRSPDSPEQRDPLAAMREDLEHHDQSVDLIIASLQRNVAIGDRIDLGGGKGAAWVYLRRSDTLPQGNAVARYFCRR